MADTDTQSSSLGRLKQFGVDAEWKAALLLPRRWEDFTLLTDRFSQVAEDQTSLVVVRPTTDPTFKYDKGMPRASFGIADAAGVMGFASQFGDTGSVKEKVVKGKRVLLKGKKTFFNNSLSFQVSEVVDKRWVGKLRPVYPGKPGVIGADLVRVRILGLLPSAIPVAANMIKDALSSIGDEQYLLKMSRSSFNNIESLLWAAHLPFNQSMGVEAQKSLERLAAADLLMTAQKEVGGIKKRDPIYLSSLSLTERTQALPYPLTDEQQKAVSEILEDLRRPCSMRRLLSGDVGTGKTAVYGTAVANAFDAGARCVILLPNVNLAAQVFNEMQSYWPDIPMALVRADTKKSQNLEEIPVLVGTTALLNRDIGHRDFIVTDEQQKFSKAQREQMAASDGHLLEVSATSIPRSQALISFGVTDLSMLTKGHVDKTIHTKLHYKEDKVELFKSSIETVQQGGQLAVVYPLKDLKQSDDEDAEINEDDQKKSAIQMFETWDKRFPGRVRLLHGQLSDDEKQQVIADMKQDKADVLISTTVIEVGLTLPRLRRLLVIGADYHGLTGLHQLRGRLCRHGGEGYFDLYIPKDKKEVKPEVIEKLSILETTTDGFKVAEHDMLQRGYGELSGDKQSGKDVGLVLGRPIEIMRLTEVAEYLPDFSKVKLEPVPFDVQSVGKVSSNEASEDVEALKWFGSHEKAQAWIQKQEQPENYEIQPAGSRFNIVSLCEFQSRSEVDVSSNDPLGIPVGKASESEKQLGLF